MLKHFYYFLFITLFYNHFYSQHDIESIKDDIYCYDVDDGCVYRDAFSSTIGSIYKIDSTFFNSREYYLIIDVDGRYNELHLLISNGMKNFSVLGSDLNKVDSLFCQRGISKYWSLSIKESWKKTIKAIEEKWYGFDDAPESIGLIIKKSGKRYRVKTFFGE